MARDRPPPASLSLRVCTMGLITVPAVRPRAGHPRAEGWTEERPYDWPSCRISPALIKVSTQGWPCMYKASRIFTDTSITEAESRPAAIRDGGGVRRTDG